MLFSRHVWVVESTGPNGENSQIIWTVDSPVTPFPVYQYTLHVLSGSRSGANLATFSQNDLIRQIVCEDTTGMVPGDKAEFVLI